MFNKPYTRWLLLFLGVNLVGAGVAVALWFAGNESAAVWTDALTSVVAAGVLGIGLRMLWEFTLVRVLAGAFVLRLAAGLTLVYFFTDYKQLAIAVLGTLGMGATFIVGLWLIRLALWPAVPVFGVARTVIDEAVRMRIVVAFVVLLAVMVPILPLTLDRQQLLSYRIQFFLQWSLSLVSFFLSLLTVFLGCWTITSEIKQKVIFLTMTKPVGRFQYLIGKWLGVVLINLLLVAVSGGGIYTFAKVLQRGKDMGPIDRSAVDNQVLSARDRIEPKPTKDYDLNQLFNEKLAKLRREQPDVYGKEGEPLPPDKAQEIANQVRAQWHAMGPGDSRGYLFTDLSRAKNFGDTLQLQFKPKYATAPPDRMVRMAMRVNGVPYPVPPLADNNVHVLPIPTDVLDKDGNLLVEMQNINPVDPMATFPGTITFSPGDGLGLYYTVDTFGANLARGMAMLWIRLSFLATLALMAGTFLGFPVACLVSLTVYFPSAASAFLSESLSYYGSSPSENLAWWDYLTAIVTRFGSFLADGKVWDATKMIIGMIGRAFVWVIPSFSAYSPAPLIADGLLIPYKLLYSAALHVGLISGGACVLVAYLVFRGRELAKITV